MKSTSKKKPVVPVTPSSAQSALAAELAQEASKLPPKLTDPGVPLAVFLHEASRAATFLRARWPPREKVTACLSEASDRISLRTADEIDVLVSLVQDSTREAAFKLAAPEEGQVARGRFLLRELRLALEFYVDDGVTDENDARVEGLASLHGSDPTTIAKLGHALADYAAVGLGLEEGLGTVPGFDHAVLEESLRVAQQLRSGASLEERADLAAFRATRAGYLALIHERVGRIRRVARYIFRAHPEIVREVTSAYGRESRRARIRAENAPPKTPEPGESGDASG